MLSFDIRDLERHGAVVDGWLEPSDDVWIDGDQRPDTPIHATGRLSKAGPGRYYWSGHIAGSATLSCRRCLADASLTVDESVHVLFAEAGDEVADDPEAYVLPARATEVDLRPAVREQWLLSAAPLALCRDDCKGICAQCGADLNSGPCGCNPNADPRWDALRATRHSTTER